MDFLNQAQHLQFLQHLLDLQRDIVVNDAAIAQVVQARRRWRVGIRRRAFWVRPWLLRKPIYGHYETLLTELLADLNREDQPAFRNYTCMDREMFFELVDRLYPRIIAKQDTW